MKKRIITIMISILFVLTTSITRASDLSIGMTSFYSWYSPFWKDFYDKVEIDPALMMGPVISWGFSDNFTFTAVILYSVMQYKTDIETGPVTMGSGSQSNVHVSNAPLTRVDSDLTISYTLTQYFKLFAGFKFMTVNNDEVSGTGASGKNVNGYCMGINEFGGGAGVSAAIPLSLIFDNLYFQCGLSYCSLCSPLQLAFTDTSGSTYYYGQGFNSTVSLSYYIESLNTSIALGGRYQALWYKSSNDVYNASGNMDRYYGVTLSLMYYF